jgi:hypothetical protein
MGNILKNLFVLTLTAGVAFAGDDKDLKKCIDDQSIYVETSQKGIVLSGYVDVGYSYNFQEATLPKGAFADNNQARGDFSVNAVKIALEKQLSDANTYQAGFRADLLIGEDAAALGGTAGGQASEDYLLEQAYVNFRVPVGNGLDFKFGKFVTLLGYEVIERPANMNISYGNLFVNMIPLYHTGILASYRFNDMVSADFGVVNGWNVSDNAGVDAASDGVAFTGAVTLTNPGGNATLKQSFIVSPWGDPGAVPAPLAPILASTDNQFVGVYDIWGNWAPKFANDKLLLGFNVDLGCSDSTLDLSAIPIPFQIDNGTTWWGAALYAKYQFTEQFSLATRAEYVHNDDGQKFYGNIFGVIPGNFPGGVDIYSWTVTGSFDICENLLTRLEYRCDQGDLINQAFNSIENDFVQTLSLQLVYNF